MDNHQHISLYVTIRLRLLDADVTRLYCPHSEIAGNTSKGILLRGGVQTPQGNLQLLWTFGLEIQSEASALGTMGSKVVAAIALGERPTDRAVLASMLWPYTSDKRAQANLRTTLWRITQAAPGLLTIDGSTLQIDAAFTIDHRHAVACARILLARDELREPTTPEEFREWLPLLSAMLLVGPRATVAIGRSSGPSISSVTQESVRQRFG